MFNAPHARFLLSVTLGAASLSLVACGADKGDEGTTPETDSEGLGGDDGGDDSGGDDGTSGELSCDAPVVAAGDVALDADSLVSFCDEHNAVEGDLVLSGGGFSDITALSCLCSVGGTLVVEGTELKTLDGLADLSIAGGLSIVDNADLNDLTGLSGVTSVPGAVTISGSPELVHLTGLDHLESTGPFTLEGLGIANLRGLGSLHTVGGDFTVRALTGLADMSGAGRLDFVDGSFIVENTGSHDFTGLDNIRRVRQAFILRDSEASLVGLDSLSSIGGTLLIEQATRLTSLDGLSGLAEIGGHLRIEDAPTLNSLSGPSNLRNITGSLWLAQTNVTSLSGISGIIAVGGVHLDTNPYLTSTAGLPPVIQLSELVLHWNADLVDLTHLDTIRTVDGPLTISGHASLAQLDELYTIEAVTGDVTIVNNVAMSAEEAQGLVDAIGPENIGGTIEVSGNSG